MRDNRGEWSALGARQTDVLFRERMALAAVAVARTTVDMVRFVTFRSDLYRSRQQLRDMSEAQLLDIGLTREQANAEAARPFFED